MEYLYIIISKLTIPMLSRRVNLPIMVIFLLLSRARSDSGETKPGQALRELQLLGAGDEDADQCGDTLSQ